MSYLIRISARVARPGTPAHAIMPKGLDKPRTPAMARMSATESEELEDQPQLKNEGEEQVTPLRPQETSEDDQMALVRRQETAEEDETMAPMRRQAEEEEETAQPLRRQAEEEEEEPIQAMRQEAEEEEEAIQPMPSIARQEEVPLEDTGQTVPPPTQESLEPGAVPVSNEFAGEEEPSALQALQRNFLSVSALSTRQATKQHAVPEHPSVNRPLQETFRPYPSFAPDWSDGMGTSNAPNPNLGSDDQRPNVVIDQVEVLIHEAASPVDRSVPRSSRDRAMRARYLRRL